MSSWMVCILAVILKDEYAVSVGDYGHIAWCASGREPKDESEKRRRYIFLWQMLEGYTSTYHSLLPSTRSIHALPHQAMNCWSTSGMNEGPRVPTTNYRAISCIDIV
jgi:hypothetical protein